MLITGRATYTHSLSKHTQPYEGQYDDATMDVGRATVVNARAGEYVRMSEPPEL
jgi:hypothetical protein